MNQRVRVLPSPVSRMVTRCDGCDKRIILDVPEDVLIGGECPCGYYTTRYQPGMEPR